MENILSYSLRVVLIFIFTYFATRVLSKKAMAEMTAYEMTGVILLSTVAAEPLVTKVTLKAIWGVGLIIGLIHLMSRLALINKLAPILEHTPTVVIRNGQIDLKALREDTLSVNHLLGLLRQQGYDKVSDVEFAIFEPEGELSVFPKSQLRPLHPSDLNLPTQYEGLTIPLIIDGAIIEQNLQHVKQTKAWLVAQLSAQNINNPDQVALAQLDSQGNLIISRKDTT